LGIAGANLWVGVVKAGYTVSEELPIFLLIFGTGGCRDIFEVADDLSAGEAEIAGKGVGCRAPYKVSLGFSI